LEQHSKLRRSELKDIRRQQVEEYNAAIRAMSQGDQLGGMKQLDALGWVHEAEGQYVERAANAYFAATADGTQLDRCIAISPTWEENHRFTDAIRKGLKERSLLGKETAITIHDQLDWTVEQKKNAANYRPGMLVTFDLGLGSIRRGQTLEVDRVEAGMLRLKGVTRSIDVGVHAKKLTVSLARTLDICPGDKILIRRNGRSAGLINGQVLTVSCIQTDGALETKEGKLIPPAFRHFGHGYVVTSYKSQGRTHDQVVIAAEQLDAKSAYVACSRGRKEAQIFTPSKEHLFQKLGRPADRLAATDVIGSSRSAFWQREQQLAWQRAAKDADFLHAAFSHSRTHEIELGR
jgi:hypothetical protein